MLMFDHIDAVNGLQMRRRLWTLPSSLIKRILGV